MKILLKEGLALLEKEGRLVTEKTDIFVEGNRIKAVGSCANDFSPEAVYDCTDKLVMPGLINSHTHAYMTLFRNYADDMAFFDWLSSVQAVEEYMTEEDCYWGTLLAALEMIKSGTTCFVDMNIKSASKGVKEGPKSACSGAARESGMRAVITRGLSGFAQDPDSLMKFGEVLDEFETFKDDELITMWFGPHAPYSCMADYLKKIALKAAELGAGQTIHLSESTAEMENMARDNGGLTPIEYVNNLGVFEVPTIAAHCVNASDNDIKIMKEKNVSAALNPKSNMKLGNGFAPAEKFLEAGVNVCLGTDGCGSNNCLNMFAEMNTAALVYKGANKKAQCISAEDVLRFATVNGAKAIGKEGELGIIKEGALADLCVLDLDKPWFYPRNSLVSSLVYSAKGSEIETVIINGEPVMEAGKVLTINEKEVYTACEEITRRLNMNSEL